MSSPFLLLGFWFPVGSVTHVSNTGQTAVSASTMANWQWRAAAFEIAVSVTIEMKGTDTNGNPLSGETRTFNFTFTEGSPVSGPAPMLVPGINYGTIETFNNLKQFSVFPHTEEFPDDPINVYQDGVFDGNNTLSDFLVNVYAVWGMDPISGDALLYHDSGTFWVPVYFSVQVQWGSASGGINPNPENPEPGIITAGLEVVGVDDEEHENGFIGSGIWDGAGILSGAFLQRFPNPEPDPWPVNGGLFITECNVTCSMTSAYDVPADFP